MNFGAVKIVNNEKNNIDIINEKIKINNQEDAFYVLDVGDIINKHETWLSKMPRVKPHFALKCNPDSTVIKTLAALGASFDCASKYEIEQVLSTGVCGERIIFTNTMKPNSHIKYAKRVGVNRLAVDSDSELCKIKHIFPEAQIIIRFRCDALKVGTSLGSKCGCDPTIEAPKLIRKAKDLGLEVHGFSFHVGSLCSETAAFIRGMKISLDLINYAKALGFQNVEIIDIGGGFPGDTNHPIDMFAEAINEFLNKVDPSIKVISEPGRYYVSSAFTLACLVHGKRTVEEKNGTRIMYYVNDGTYGSFIESLLDITIRIPVPLNKPASEKKHRSTFWGPTCDSYDVIVRDCDFPELNVGDWVIWPDMGAYTICLAGTFNGIFPPVVHPFIIEKKWKTLSQDLELIAGKNKMIDGRKKD